MPLPSPKSRFLSDPKRAERWADLVASAEFQLALDHALLQMLYEGTTLPPVYDAQARAHQLDGAKRLSLILQRLGERELPGEKAPETILDYRPAKVPAHLQPAKPQP
jgi:hypothetical protein